jgi:site-specific recombinase XerD
MCLTHLQYMQRASPVHESTFASWLTMRGVSLHKIAKFLGHSSVTTTEKHYAALQPETLHEDIEKLG